MRHLHDTLERNTYTVYTCTDGLFMTTDFITDIHRGNDVQTRPVLLSKENDTL
jgi:hypothetical protein